MPQKKSTAERSMPTNPSTKRPSTKGKGEKGPPSGESVPHAGTEPTLKQGIKGVPGSKNDARRCHATANRTGERCKRAAIPGGRVCTSHGGAAPQVQRSAKHRLLDLVEPAINELAKLLNRKDVEDNVRLKAIQILLDRTGFGPSANLNVQDDRWNALIAQVASADGTVEVDRDLPPLVVGGGDLAEPEDPEADDIVDAEWFEERTGNATETTHYTDAERHADSYANGPLNPITATSVPGTEYDPEPVERYGKGAETREEALLRAEREGRSSRKAR